MKKVSLLFSMIALMGFSAMAQQPNQQQIREKKSQATITTTGHALQMPKPDGLLVTDTFGNLIDCDTVFYIWQFATNDWLSGHNSYIDSAKAERYQGITGSQIDGLWVFFGDATYTNSNTQKCHLRVWDDNGIGNTPGTKLGSVDRTHKSIADDIAAGNLTTVYFGTPITMPAGGNFYAGVELDYKLKNGLPVWDSTRSVTLVNSEIVDIDGNGQSCGDTTYNTAWEKWSDGTWHSYVYSYGLGTRNPVFPIVSTNTGCTITINPSAATICKGKQVSLTASGAATYSWAPSTGLNCVTCATVSAKPNATTTYTVTGDGGACSATVKVTVNTVPGAGVQMGTCSGGAVLLTRTGSPATGVSFQWYKNNAVIAGATNNTYSATVTAQYKVKVTNNTTGCTKTSPNVSVTINCKTTNAISGFEASVYPNPFTKSMSVNFATGSTETATVALLDFSGKMIREYRNVDVSSPLEINENLSAGVYFVRVVQGGNEKMLKVVKSE